MKALFDTNILIDYLNGNPAAETEFGRYRARSISVITWMEVLCGPIGSKEEEDVIDMFLRDFTVVGVSRHVARTAIELRRTRRIRIPDAIIWATAQVESALLVTRNTKDFPADAPGIRVPY